jgi:hypothetical protein
MLIQSPGRKGLGLEIGTVDHCCYHRSGRGRLRHRDLLTRDFNYCGAGGTCVRAESY